MEGNCYVKLDGIDGESTDKQHEKWIQMWSWQWGVSNTGRAGSGVVGQTRGVSMVQDFSFTKQLDKASAKIQEKCLNGTNIPKVTISVCGIGEKELHEYLRYDLNDCVITSYSIGGTSEMPQENLTVNFSKVEWTYTPLGRDGKPDSGAKQSGFKWDVTKNTAA